MANERIPEDPYLASDDQFNRGSRLDRDLQADPELAEGPASNGRVALFALAIALVLGAVFYGLNNSTINQASTSPPAQTAQTKPANPPANTEPGTTTGAATNRPTPPQSSPQGQEIDRSANPNNNNK